MIASFLESLGFARIHRWFCRLDGSIPLPSTKAMFAREDWRTIGDYSLILGWRRYFAAAQFIRILLYAPLIPHFMSSAEFGWATFAIAMLTMHFGFLLLEVYQSSLARLAIAHPPDRIVDEPRKPERVLPNISKLPFETVEFYQSLGVEKFGRSILITIQRLRGVSPSAPTLSDPKDLGAIAAQTRFAEIVHWIAAMIEILLIGRSAEASAWFLVAWVAPYVYLDFNLAMLQRLHRLRLAKQVESRLKRRGPEGSHIHA